MANLDREYFRRKLLEEKERLARQLDRFRERGMGRAEPEVSRELSSYDNHPADDGSTTYERGKDLGLMGNAHLLLGRVDDALRKMEEGTYGWCDACGGPIEPGRLEAVPYAALCYRCQREQDSLPDRHLRPLEEEVIPPPFAEPRPRRPGTPGINGEDVWQELARYGNADGPANIPGARDYEKLFEGAGERRGVVEEVEALVDEEGEPLQEQIYERDRDEGRS